MLGRIWRQRLRVMVGGGLWAWVILLMMHRMGPDQPWSDPLWLGVGIALCVVAGLGLAVLHGALMAVLMPSWLSGVEVVPLAGILLMLLPEPAWSGALADIGPFLWVFLFTFAIHRLLYGPQFGWRFRAPAAPWVHRFIVDAPPDEVWRRVAPLPGHEGSFWWTGSTFRPAPPGSAHQIEVTWAMRRGAPTQNEPLKIEALDPGRYLRMINIYTQDGSGDFTQDGSGELVDICLTPLPDGRTEVAFRSQLMNQPLGGRLYYALGSYGEDYTACLEARVTGRPDRTITGRLIPHRTAAPPPRRGPWGVSSASAVPAR